MGINDGFGPKADFSGMDGTRFLSISAIYHKAWGEVNEEGTEAAAATVAGIRATAVMKTHCASASVSSGSPFHFLDSGQSFPVLCYFWAGSRIR